MSRKFFNFAKKHGAPKIPQGVRVYAVGDIHGRIDLLQGLFNRIDADLRKRAVPRPIEIYLGDYIDRGPCSREVVEALIARSLSHEIVCLKGNHETFPGQFAADPAILADWGQIGGFDTLMSYGLQSPNGSGAQDHRELASQFRVAFPLAHKRFIETLKTSFVCGDYYFVHAGVRPGVALRDQTDDDRLWIREEFLDSEDDFGKIVVHGHTPVMEPDFRSNRINVDTGAYATGRLTCLAIEGETLSLV